MKSCRRQSKTRPAASRQSTSGERTVSVPVHRYSHPIHTKPTLQQGSSAEELLAGILQALSRQSDLLEDLLRRVGGDIPDTK